MSNPTFDLTQFSGTNRALGAYQGFWLGLKMANTSTGSLLSLTKISVNKTHGTEQKSRLPIGVTSL